VWNEPDFPSWWKGAPNPAEYLALLDAVAAGIRRADPDAEVVLGSMTNVQGSTEGGYLDRLYALGAARHFDTIAINPYSTSVDALLGFLRGAREIATKYGDAHKPIRVTEWGWATKGNSDVIVTTEACQAALLYAAARRLDRARQELRVRSIVQFQWHDVPTTSTAWPHHTGVINADGTPKPSFTAFADAVASRPPPEGYDLVDACPTERRLVGVVAGAVASDGFSRTVDGGWGNALVGGAYAVAGAATAYSVGGGTARMQVTSTAEAREAALPDLSTTATEVRTTFNTDKAATGLTGQVLTVVARRVAPGTEYRVRLRPQPDGTVRAGAQKVVAGAVSAIGAEVPLDGVRHTPGVPLSLLVQVVGDTPTTIRLKMWAPSRSEPADWQWSRTDDEAVLRDAGAVALRAELTGTALGGPVTFTFDDLHVTAPK
jgi:hypothetical protein